MGSGFLGSGFGSGFFSALLKAGLDEKNKRTSYIFSQRRVVTIVRNNMKKCG
jgi:hypothetical protein